MIALRGSWLAWQAVVGLAMVLGPVSVAASAAEPKGGETVPDAVRTATVTRGDLVVTLSATGTVEPQEVVDVAPQVAGIIEKLGPDPRGKTDPRYQGKTIDFGSPVGEGDILAKIDDASYVAQVELAQATCARAQAELAQARAKAELAAGQWRRAQDRLKGKSISDSEYDTLKADDQVTRAVVAAAEASVLQARAAWKQAEINLARTTVKSPVQGVVIDRRVNVGQAAVLSPTAPSLFLVASDLKRLQVWVSVNEADIARIREKQPVRFTVDAFPGKVFEGEVKQIRLNATMTQNVVTYTVVVATENREGTLLPYLTANVRFEVGRREDVLLVPNAALRWQPKPQWIAPNLRDQAETGSQKAGVREGQSGKKESPRRPRVWVQDGRFARPIDVQVGPSDGTMTEITGADVKQGMEVIVSGRVARTDAGRK